ncbi:ABC transporter ATP-binding protein [Candidatus Curtissbacteria bacterium]|nr:ABC transporter ATP-binding protein [Candidatus Curtissbacteria bacterium]
MLKVNAITVKNLIKTYRVAEKSPGVLGSIKSLVRRKYRDVLAVNDISFNVEEGELVGFIGPNGAGKTTTLKCLSGLLYPTSGEVSVLNHKPWERKTQFLKSIAFVMGQKNQLWWDLPPMETFLLNKEIYDIDGANFQETIKELSSLLEIGNILLTPVKKLSLGQRMKCELVAALVHRPKVLFLDEPTIGLDVVIQKNLREFIKTYNQKYQSTIILTSHYMRDVEALARRVIIIDGGKIIFDGLLETLVKKYAPYKLISLILKKEVDVQKLKKLGIIKSYNYPQAVLSVESRETNKVVTEILKNLPVDDINVQEADIEDVIRHVFQNKK